MTLQFPFNVGDILEIQGFSFEVESINMNTGEILIQMINANAESMN